MMFEMSSGVPSSEVSLQFSPQVEPYGRHRSIALAVLFASALFGAVVFVALALYSGAELALSSGAESEGAAALFASNLRASALISALGGFGFLATLIALRGAWTKLGLSARVASSFTAAIATLFVLGLNTRGPIAYAVGVEATDFWPLGLVLLSLGMSMALFALKTGQVLDEALSPMDDWAREEARRARRYRFAASLVQAAKRPKGLARPKSGRSRGRDARRSTDFQVEKKGQAGGATVATPSGSFRRRRPTEPLRRRTASGDHTGVGGSGESGRLSVRAVAKVAVTRVGRRRLQPTVAASSDREAAQKTAIPNRGLRAIQPVPRPRALHPLLQPYPETRRTVSVITTGLRRLGLLRAASPDHEAAQTELPIASPDCMPENPERDALGRKSTKISKTKRVPRRRRPTQDPSLQGTLFRAR